YVPVSSMMAIPSIAESIASACCRTLSALFASCDSLSASRAAKHKIETPSSENLRIRHPDPSCATCSSTISGASANIVFVNTIAPMVLGCANPKGVGSADGFQLPAHSAANNSGIVQQRSNQVPVGASYIVC